MTGLAPASEDIHPLFCGAGRIFIHSDRLELVLHCLKVQETWKHLLLLLALDLLLCGFRWFLFCWTRDHTDLEQMLKKNRPNIRQNGH